MPAALQIFQQWRCMRRPQCAQFKIGKVSTHLGQEYYVGTLVRETTQAALNHVYQWMCMSHPQSAQFNFGRMQTHIGGLGPGVSSRPPLPFSPSHLPLNSLGAPITGDGEELRMVYERQGAAYLPVARSEFAEIFHAPSMKKPTFSSATVSIGWCLIINKLIHSA